MPTIGRNEPCPCGSGKKYKRCCLDNATDDLDIGRADRLHAMDRDLVDRVLDWAEVHASDALSEIDIACGIPLDPDMIEWGVRDCVLASLTCHRRRTLADRFAADQGNALSSEERAWLEALGRAWLGLWEVVDVRPAWGLRAKDLLTHEVRDIRDVSLSFVIGRGEVMCARVVDADGLALVNCVHPHSLRPSEADEVLQAFLGRRRTRPPIPPGRLRPERANDLLAFWHVRVQARQQAPLPHLQNTDGDELVETKDTLELPPGLRGDVLAALGRLKGAEVEPADEHGVTVVFVRPPKDTVVGRARVGATRLVLETNSERRADALLARVQGALPTPLRVLSRDRLDMQDMLATRLGKEAPPTIQASHGPEIDAMLRDAKTAHYADWPDTPLPMLGGKSPRQVMGNKTLRRQVESTLKDIAVSEARLPPGQRYDVNILRAALGIPLDP